MNTSVRRASIRIWMLFAVVILFEGLSAVSAQEANIPHFTDNYIVVNKARLHYVIGGSGSPVILLHGWPETLIEWQKIMPLLAENHTVVALDTRGASQSEVTDCCYDKKSLADDVYALAQALNFKHFTVIGHDIGGMIAYAVASAHPESVDHLVILEAPLPSAEFYKLPQLNPNTPTGEQPGWHFAFHAVPDLPEQLIGDHVALYLNWFYTHATLRKTAIPEASISEYVRSYSEPKRLHAGFELYRAFPADIRLNEEVYFKNRLKMPVLAIGGEVGLSAAVKEQMLDKAENVQGGVIAGCGHFLPEECPVELVKHIEEFLAGKPFSQ